MPPAPLTRACDPLWNASRPSHAGLWPLFGTPPAPLARACGAVYSHDGPIRPRTHGYILVTGQSDLPPPPFCPQVQAQAQALLTGEVIVLVAVSLA
eukprot:8143169-Pyramimonas_sp.AAC.1